MKVKLSNGINNKGEISIFSLFIYTLLIILVLTFVPLFNTSILLSNVQAASQFLTGQGYVVLASGEYNILNAKLDAIKVSADAAVVEAHSVFLTVSNETIIFPEETNAKITLVAGGIADTFGAWAEIVDSNGVTLSSKFVASPGHISEINTEDYSVKGKRYMVEIAYGVAKEVIARTRIKSEAVGATPFVYYLEAKSKHIPIGETVYYRMKCETAGATMECSFRYYYD